MRRVAVIIELPLSLPATWELLTNTSNYPLFIAYLKRIEQSGVLKKGSDWHDITTVLWVPLRIKHTVTCFTVNRQFTNKLVFPMNGWMIQDFTLEKKEDNTVIHAQITFDLGSMLANAVIGPIHEKRVRMMMNKTAKNLKVYVRTRTSSRK